MAKSLALHRQAILETGAEIDALRQRIGTLKEEREAVQQRYIPKAEALRRLDRHIAAIESGAAVSAERLPVHFGALLYAEEQPRLVDPVPDGRLVLMLLAPMLRERATAELDNIYAKDEGITEAERAKSVARLDAEITAAEIAEEALIRSAEAVGFHVLRREDAAPEIVLAHDDEFKQAATPSASAPGAPSRSAAAGGGNQRAAGIPSEHEDTLT